MDAVTGRWSGAVVWGISVSYKSICRKGETKECILDIKMSPGTFSAVNIVAYFAQLQ